MEEEGWKEEEEEEKWIENRISRLARDVVV